MLLENQEVGRIRSNNIVWADAPIIIPTLGPDHDLSFLLVMSGGYFLQVIMLQIYIQDQMCLLALIIIQNVLKNEEQTVWLSYLLNI